MSIRRRAYEGLEDDQAVRGFLSRCFRATGHPYLGIDPPNWERLNAAARLGSKQRSIQLWELHENSRRAVVGLLEFHAKRRQFSLLADPAAGEIEALILDWLEEKYRAQTKGQNEQKATFCAVCERNEVLQAVLRRRGYVKGELTTVFRRRACADVPPETTLPSGFQFREIQSLRASQKQARIAAENEIFGDRHTPAFLEELGKAPLYRPDLDLVVISSAGDIAAFSTIWHDAHNQAGYFEPVAVAPAFRRQGLGKALMLEGFRRLRKCGAKTAFLGHDTGNVAGDRLYEAVGMAIFDREYRWKRAVDKY